MAPTDLSADISSALARRELSLAYQPVVRLDDGVPRGFEALMRWTHPRHGPVSPEVFVPLAEATGAIHEIGEWAISEAAAQWARFVEESGRAGLMIGVNVSGIQLETPGFGDRVRELLRAAGAGPQAIGLELTESVPLRDPAGAAQTIDALRDVGVHVALDDFGTGYNSLSTLLQLPVAGFKVDKSFVAPLPDERSACIVRAVLDLAERLGLHVIVEGIETDEQECLLRKMGARLGQGYRYARPLDPDAARRWLALAPAD